MTIATPEYVMKAPFAAASPNADTPPRIFGAPTRYVQGEGVIEDIGRYLQRLGFKHCAVLCSARSAAAEGGVAIRALETADIATRHLVFGGECSIAEIEQQMTTVRAAQTPVDSLLAIGGGKVVDAGRAIANRLNVPFAAAPSLASNDAPCASVSVIYSNEGATENAELYDSHPALVLVDTGIVARADARYLAAGMGDALATWYEARTSARSEHAATVFGGRPTLAGAALSAACAQTIYQNGIAALRAARDSRVTPALEDIVEANTLLSGLGYENGGLAAAHGVAQGYTAIEHIHTHLLHGELVAMGVLTQLMLESDEVEARKAAEFFVSVGLPVHLEQLGLSATSPAMDTVVEASLAFPFITNMATPVTQDSLKAAIVKADTLGYALANEQPVEAN